MTANLPVRLVADRGEAMTMHKLASDRALKWMDDTIALHEKAARDLREMSLRFRRAADAERFAELEGAKPGEVLSWFVNGCKWVAINMRLDSAVDHATALAQAAAELKS